MKKLLVLCSFCVLFARADTTRITLSDGASYQQNAGISPGAIITIKGDNLTNVTLTAPDPSRPPQTLGGVKVTINDVACPIYYVSPTQVNALVDPSVPPGLTQAVLVSSTVVTQTSVTVEATSSPGIFTLNGKGSSDGAILNTAAYQASPFSVNTGSNPTYLALFLTSLDTTTTPTVWIGGISVPVLFAGSQGTYPGMQQINAQLPASLAGTGRVEVVVEQRGRRSNAAEIVVLPNQPVFADDQPNQMRSREIAAVAWVPGTSLALVADENDDVVRVVDLSQRRVTRVIALPDGAQPVAIGVHGSGTLAVVAARGRDSVILLDLGTFKALGEFAVGFSPSAIAVASDQAVIVNSDSDTASFFTFRTTFGSPALQVVATVPTGRMPRAVAVDSQHAYVTNESAGTITVLDLQNRTVVNTLKLGIDVRPGAIRVLEDLGVAVVAEPSAGPDGKLLFVLLSSGASTSLTVNPDHTGGASDIVTIGDRVFLLNQTGGSITTTTVALLGTAQFGPNSIQVVAPSNFKVETGARAFSLDSKDNLLLVTNEGSGTIGLVDLGTNAVTGRIDAVRSQAADSDDHADRLSASNLPTITTLAPATAPANSTATITITGTNLTGAEAILFIDPATVSGLTRGKGNVNRGNFGTSDPSFVVTDIQVNAAGTQITAKVQVQPNTPLKTRLVRVLTPNGETSLSGALTFSVVP